MPHDPIDLAIFVVVILSMLGVAAVIVCACVCGARDDRLAEEWRAERERATVALNKGWQDGA